MSTNSPSENPEKKDPRSFYHDQIFMIAGNFGNQGAVSFQVICSRLESEEPKIMALLEKGINPFENVINIVASQKETMTVERAIAFCLMEISKLTKNAAEEQRTNDLVDVIYEDTHRGANNAILVPDFDNNRSGIVKTPGLDIYDHATSAEMTPWVTKFGSQNEVNKDFRHAMDGQKIAAADRDNMIGHGVQTRKSLRLFNKGKEDKTSK